jgi:hypothetical protein
MIYLLIMFGSVNMHFHSFPSRTDTETDLANDAWTGDMLGFNVIFHHWLVLSLIFTLLTTVHPSWVSVHQISYPKVKLLRLED